MSVDFVQGLLVGFQQVAVMGIVLLLMAMVILLWLGGGKQPRATGREGSWQSVPKALEKQAPLSWRQERLCPKQERSKKWEDSVCELWQY